MRSLFLKIFLWFWLSVVLVSLTTAIIAAIMQSNSQNGAWQNQALVDIEAARSVDIYEREGAEALKRHFEDLPKRPMYAYLVDERGTEVLGQKLPERALRLVHKEFDDKSLPALLFGPGAKADEANNPLRYTPLPPKVVPGQPLRVVPLLAPPNDARSTAPALVAADQVVGPRGRRYTFLVAIPPLSVKTLLASLRMSVLTRLAAGLFLVGIFCFWLARHITGPVVQLREAAGRIADGRLSTRVPPALHKRRDEIGLLGQHFDRMAERIESLVAGQQRLLSTVSHELRSPLTRLSLAAGLLRQCPPGESAEYLDRIELETEQLDKLIAQLLTLSRIESGADTGSRKEDIHLANLVQEIAVDGNFEAQARSCMVCVGPLDSCITMGTPDQIRRAIENVVRNAIRYTKVHSQVEITMRRQGGSPFATALIQVRDYGPGVPDSDLAKIFLPFYRVPLADGSTTTNGTGLGLAITERIVRMHEGTVRAVNAPDGGLLVELTLPLKA
jgi:two-component system sensor histidine kinase CpxA